MKKIILTNSFKRPRASYSNGIPKICDQNVVFKNVFATIEEIIYSIIDKIDSTPLVLPACQNEYDIEKIVSFVDGIILPGGSSNIHPSFYNEKNILENQTFDINHDNLDFAIIKYAIKYNKPILGICRGMQAMNVFNGGTLTQKIQNSNVNHLASYKNEGMTEEKEFLHKINLQKDGILYNLLKKEEVEINSIHEQGVDLLGKDLLIEALSEDGLIEAFSMQNMKFFLGLQWHPEALLNSNISEKIFELFKRTL